MAIVSVLMLAYLGVETFLEVVEASRELKRASDSATSLEELWRAAQRYGERVGPQVAQVLVLAVTMVAGAGTAGGTALLASRIAMLPSFTRVAVAGASGLSINLAGLGQVSAVTVVGSTVVISLPAAVVAMTATGPEAAGGGKAFSSEKQALVDMAKADKKAGGITRGDMKAYKDLNEGLPDPFPADKVRGPEVHPLRGPNSKPGAGQQPHGHVGPVDHIPIRDEP